jgi:hypothetical protein
MRDFWNFTFFGRGVVSPTHSETLSLCFGVIGKTPGLISRNNFVKQIFVCIGHRYNVLARCDSVFPLLRCRGVWNKTCTQLSLSKILFPNRKNYVLGTFKDSAIIRYEIRRPFLTKLATAETFTSVRVEFERPPLSSTSTSSPPVSKSRIPPSNVWSVHSLIPITLMHQHYCFCSR